MTTTKPNRMELLKSLLFELHDLCVENHLNYTLTGPIARSISQTGEFPEAFDFITVAMTQGDLERLIRIVNGQPAAHRQVEYFENNPYATGMQARFCNNDTTLISVKEFEKHVNYGFYIGIKTIDRPPESQVREKLLRFFKKAWKGSCLRLSATNWKWMIPVVILKCAVLLFGGRRNAARLLYRYNRKLKFIDKWEDISRYPSVRAGIARFYGEPSWELQNVTAEGKELLLAEPMLTRQVERTPSHSTVLVDNIEAAGIPFAEVLNSDLMEDLRELHAIRNRYYKTISKARTAARTITKSWNTYLMTRDVVSLQELYSEEVVEKVRKAVRAGDYETYQCEMEPYLSARRRWQRLRVPFIPNPGLEELIISADRIFQQL